MRDNEMFDIIAQEEQRQLDNVELIASENFVSREVRQAQGSVLTNKYAEGLPGHRYYGGCVNVDKAEQLTKDRAMKLFGAEFVNVQPHSGAQANMAVYNTILQPGDIVMGMNLTSGGHLTHGSSVNFSGKLYHFIEYNVNKETERIDYDELEHMAMVIKPKLIVAGASAYPRIIDFERFGEIAHKCGAYLMVDMAHFASLVAGKVFTGDFDPVKWADIVTTTTHKTLRGPRGAMILCKKEFEDYVNKGCPMVLGGPLPHVMAAKAIALKEANSKAYQDYAHQVVKNAQALAKALQNLGIHLQTNGTDNHLMLADITSYGLTGKQAEAALFQAGVTTNANALPYDKNGAWYTSGLRLGTPALTTLGMKESEMDEVAAIIDMVLKGTKPGVTKDGKPAKLKIVMDESVKEAASKRVQALLSKFVLYPELDLDFLKKEFVK